jgi:predicted dehydrogenase
MGDWHAHVLKSMGFQDIVLCDRRREVLESVGRRYDIERERHFQNTHELIQSVRPEIWIIATTADTHRDLVVQAAEYGAKYILCEKPLACSIAECDEMITTCNRFGTRLAVNHQVRYIPAYTTAEQVIRSPEFGDFSSMTVVGGNGGLAMIGSHLFEAFRWICDERVETVQAWLSHEKLPNPRGEQFEDHGACVRATTASGKRLYFDLSADQGHSLSIIYAGRFGQIIVEPLAGQLRHTVRKSDDRAQPTTRYATEGQRGQASFNPFALEGSTRLVRDLLEGGSYPTAEDGRHAVECLVAAHLSHELGNIPIRLADVETYRCRRFHWA